ncbi:MAG TPA: hypothetical protein VMR18_01605 [Candidatus Saccharimonadales bacterium]|nr:hypothetical protein [Candidatus Saccharimonadales bacterium]
MAKLLRIVKGFRFNLLIRRPVYAVVAVVMILAVAVPIVRAESIQQQINNLNSQNSSTQASINGLLDQDQTYQQAVSSLQTQINAIQTSINDSENEQATINQKIQAGKVELANEKVVLGSDIEAMYLNGQMTTVEELATSKSLSAFVDAQTYQNAVENKIQSTMNQINALEAQLATQATQVAQLLQTQQLQQSQVVADQNKEQQLLNLNEAQQASYSQQLQANNSKISVLEAEQAAANAAEAKGVDVASGSGNGVCALSGSSYQGTGPIAGNGVAAGNYPDAWCNAPQDSMYDSNNILNRECTSFAYWYFVDVEGNSGFSVSGNAGWWWETSNIPAITFSSAVEVGAIGVEPSTATSTQSVPSLHDSTTGHVMIVVALPGQSYDGVSVPGNDVMVASMNEDEEGHFMYDLWPSADLWYINPN